MQKLLRVVLVLIIASAVVLAQNNGSNTQSNSSQSISRELARVEIKSPGITISYLEREGATEVGFRYPNDPANLTDPRGKVKVERKGGYCEIDVTKDFKLPGPAGVLYEYFVNTDNGRRLYSSFDLEGLGPERFRGKLSYVFWVVTTQGIVENLGEVLWKDDLGITSTARKIDVTTRQPVFAMMVTAEPHPYVTRPSNAVVLVNYGQRSIITNSKGVAQSDLLYYVPRPEIITFKDLSLTYPLNSSLQYRHQQTRFALAQARVAIEMGDYALADARKNKEIDPRTPETLIEKLRQRTTFSVSDELQASDALEEARSHLEKAEKLYSPLAEKENPTSSKDPLRPIVQESRTSTQIAHEAFIYANLASNAIAIKQKNILIDLLVEEDLALKETIRNLERELADLKNTIRNLETDNSNLRETIRNRDARIKELEHQVKTLETTIANLRSEISQLQAQVASLQSQLEQLQARLAQSEKENARLKNELSRICDELKKVIGTLGEIEQQGNFLTVRLKSDILFAQSEYLLPVDRDLKKDVRPRLAQLALLLQILFQDARFQFIGHTDSVDTDEYNQWLSEQRAIEVMHFFFLARLQVMDINDPLRSEYEQKIALAERLLGNEFPAWKAKSAPGGLGDRKAEKQRQQRQEVLVQLSTIVEGRGERELRVNPEQTETDQQLNRRVEIKIELPQQATFEYCK